MSNPVRPASFAKRSLAIIAAIALTLSGCVFAIGSRDKCNECGELGCTHGSAQSSANRAHCPVTGESVAKNTAPSATVDGDTYYFHCNTCKARFLADPGAYLKGDAKADAAHEDAGR